MRRARARAPQYQTGRGAERTAGRGQVLELTESFKFETGTEARPPSYLPTLRPAVPPANPVSSNPFPPRRRRQAGVNWHTGVKFSPGTYRVKKGVKIVWNGQEWIDEQTGQPTDPLA